MKDQQLRTVLGILAEEAPLNGKPFVDEIRTRVTSILDEINHDRVCIIGTHVKDLQGQYISFQGYPSYKGTILQRLELLEKKQEVDRDTISSAQNHINRLVGDVEAYKTMVNENNVLLRKSVELMNKQGEEINILTKKLDCLLDYSDLKIEWKEGHYEVEDKV